MAGEEQEAGLGNVSTTERTGTNDGTTGATLEFVPWTKLPEEKRGIGGRRDRLDLVRSHAKFRVLTRRESGVEAAVNPPEDLCDQAARRVARRPGFLHDRGIAR